MIIAQIVIAIVAMLLFDWRSGGLKTGRKRVKWTYGLLFLLVFYHLLIVAGAIRSLSFYDTALLVFGPAAETLLSYFQPEG